VERTGWTYFLFEVRKFAILNGSEKTLSRLALGTAEDAAAIVIKQSL
jgi:hypothetical protein